MRWYDRLLFGRKLTRFLREGYPDMMNRQTRFISSTRICVNCLQPIARTTPEYRWYHVSTGTERCDGVNVPIGEDFGPRSEIALPRPIPSWKEII